MAFHPLDSTALYSADCGGMINQFDLKQSDPDEILETAINTETPIRRFGFFGPKSQYIYAITADETVSLHDIEEASPIAEYSRARGSSHRICRNSRVLSRRLPLVCAAGDSSLRQAVVRARSLCLTKRSSL